MLWNGSSYDREWGNAVLPVEASSAKTATGTGTVQTNCNAAGVILFVNVTAVSGTTPTLTVKVQHSFDGTTFADVPGAVTASITGSGLTVLTLFPGVTVAANAAVSYPLARFWRLAWTIGGTTPSFTFAAYANYIDG